MKKIFLIATSCLFIVIIYQNCDGFSQIADQQNQGKIESKKVIDELQDIKEISFARNFARIPDGNFSETQLNLKFIESAVNGEKYHKIEEQIFPSKEVINEYCVPVEITNNLLALLQESSVCEFKVEASAEIVCTQIYVAPYASVVSSETGEDAVDLGQRTSGCSGSSDICSNENRTILQSELLRIKELLKIEGSNYPCQ